MSFVAKRVIGADYAQNMEELDTTNIERSRDHIQTLERGIRIMRAFAVVEHATVASLAEAVGLARPVVRRVLITLENMGYAQQYRGEWVLTARVLELGQGYFSGTSLPEIAQSYLQMIATSTNESCSVSVLDSPDVVHIARVEVQRIMPYSMRVGSRLPAHATAMGKVLLAALSGAELGSYLAHTELRRFTPTTAVDADDLRARLAAVREQGYALSEEELELGMLAVAVPIRTPDETIGTLSSTSTTVRTTVEDMVADVVPLLISTADQIGRDYFVSNR